MKLLSLSYQLERFNHIENACLIAPDGTRQEVTHQKTQHIKANLLLLSFKEITSVETAQKFVSGSLVVSEDSVTALPEDTYFHHQLIGMDVISFSDKTSLGVISNIIETGGNDVYEVITPTGKTFLLPAIFDVVKDVDIKKNQMTIEVMDGLLD